MNLHLLFGHWLRYRKVPCTKSKHTKAYGNPIFEYSVRSIDCSRSYSRINYLDPEHVGDLSEAAGFNSLVAESAFCAMINTNIVPNVGQVQQQ